MESKSSQGQKQVIEVFPKPSFPRELWEPNCHFELGEREPPLNKDTWPFKPRAVPRQLVKVCNHHNFFAVSHGKMESHHKAPAAADCSLSTGYNVSWKILLTIMENLVAVWAKYKLNPIFEGLETELEFLHKTWIKYRQMQNRKKDSATKKRLEQKRLREEGASAPEANQSGSSIEQERPSVDSNIVHTEPHLIASTGDILTTALTSAQQNLDIWQNNCKEINVELVATVQQVTSLYHFKIQKEKELQHLTECIKQEQEKIDELQEIIQERVTKKSKQ